MLWLGAMMTLWGLADGGAVGEAGGLAYRDPISRRFVAAEVALPQGRELAEGVVGGAPRRVAVERAVAGPVGGYRVGLRESGRAVSAVVAWRGEEGEVLVGCGPEDPGHGVEAESDAESVVPPGSAGGSR